MWLHRGDDRLLSPCCQAPQDVALGAVTFDPDGSGHWRQAIDHYCSACGARFDPEQGIHGKGELFKARQASRARTEGR